MIPTIEVLAFGVAGLGAFYAIVRVLFSRQIATLDATLKDLKDGQIALRLHVDGSLLDLRNHVDETEHEVLAEIGHVKERMAVHERESSERFVTRHEWGELIRRLDRWDNRQDRTDAKLDNLTTLVSTKT